MINEIEKLLEFLPVFEDPKFKPIVEWDTEDVFPQADYCQEVEDFFELVRQPCWKDYDYVPQDTEKMVNDPGFIKNADIGAIKTMLTYCERGERFSDGHWGAMIEKGKITAILHRLNEIKDEI